MPISILGNILIAIASVALFWEYGFKELFPYGMVAMLLVCFSLPIYLMEKEGGDF